MGSSVTLGNTAGKPTGFVLSTYSKECLGESILGLGFTPASAIFPTANAAVFIPFRLLESKTYLGMLWANGAAVSGNIDAGIYNPTGTRLASIGTTVQTGTTAFQQVAFSVALSLNPGIYYLAVAMDNIIGTMIRANPSGIICAGLGMRSLANAFVLPADASTWTLFNLSGFIPLIAAYENSWL